MFYLAINIIYVVVHAATTSTQYSCELAQEIFTCGVSMETHATWRDRHLGKSVAATTDRWCLEHVTKG